MTFRNKNFFNRLVISYKMSKQRGLTELINPDSIIINWLQIPFKLGY